MTKFNSSDFQGTIWTVFDGDYYVSSFGDDIDGDGSPKKPFLTLEKVYEISKTGDKIVTAPEYFIEGFNSKANEGSGFDGNRSKTTSIDQNELNLALDNLKDGVSTDGDTLKKLYNLIQEVVGVSARANDLQERDVVKLSLRDQQNVYVEDASADPTVNFGWAIYKYLAQPDRFVKIGEQESVEIPLQDTANFSFNAKWEPHLTTSYLIDFEGKFEITLKSASETGGLRWKRRVKPNGWDDNNGTLYSTEEINAWGANLQNEELELGCIPISPKFDTNNDGIFDLETVGCIIEIR